MFKKWIKGEINFETYLFVKEELNEKQKDIV